MIISFSDKPVIKGEKSIFLAGPTLRNSNFNASWRKPACDILKKLGYDGIVYVPEFEIGNMSVELTTQAGWEREALIASDIIIFYVARKFPELPGLTTNIEYGMWLSKKPDACMLCLPTWAEKNNYLKWLYAQEKPNAPIYETLEDILAAAVKRLEQ